MKRETIFCVVCIAVLSILTGVFAVTIDKRSAKTQTVGMATVTGKEFILGKSNELKHLDYVVEPGGYFGHFERNDVAKWIVDFTCDGKEYSVELSLVDWAQFNVGEKYPAVRTIGKLTQSEVTISGVSP